MKGLRVLGRWLESLLLTVYHLLDTLLDITLHAMVPAVGDPYFGDIFIAFRFVLAFVTWTILFISAGFLIACPYEMWAKRKRRTSEVTTDDYNTDDYQADDEDGEQMTLNKVKRKRFRTVSGGKRSLDWATLCHTLHCLSLQQARPRPQRALTYSCVPGYEQKENMSRIEGVPEPEVEEIEPELQTDDQDKDQEYQRLPENIWNSEDKDIHKETTLSTIDNADSASGIDQPLTITVTNNFVESREDNDYKIEVNNA